MTTETVALPCPDVALPGEGGRAVRFRVLLAPYLVVPLALGVVLLDRLALGGELAQRLPRMPDALPLFTVFFNFPHIVASFFPFADRAYLRAYGRRLAITGAVLFALTALVHRVAEAEGIAILASLFTTYHLAAQQLGMAAMQLRVPGGLVRAWKAAMLATGMGAMLVVVDGSVVLGRAKGLLAIGCLAAVVPSLALTTALHRRTTRPEARPYLWANQALFATMAFTAVGGYPLVAWLAIRVVHDLSAFYVYGVHDENRHREGRPNLVHRALGKLGIAPRLGGPLLGVVVAFVLERLVPSRVTMHAVYWLSLLHYELEGVVWKGGTPHRRHTPFR